MNLAGTDSTLRPGRRQPEQKKPQGVRHKSRVDYDRFFKKYAGAYNDALEGRLDTALIRSFFSDCFLAAGPETIRTGHNNWFFAFVLRRAYSFYRKIGTRHLSISHIEVTGIDQFHDMVKVGYSAAYRKKDGDRLCINFEVTYLLQTRTGPRSDLSTKIFAFIGGDEMKAYKEKALI